MRRLALFILSILLLACGCSVTRRQILPEHQKTVKFYETGGSNYLSPSYQKIADTTYVASVIVRTRVEPTSEIVTEKLKEIDIAAMELENSLVRNNLRVIDRPVYHDKEASNTNLAYPFDFIIEILEVQPTRHFTGISITNRYRHFLSVSEVDVPHYLEGRKMLVKIVDAKTAEVVALLNCEYVPCRNGCKIKYDKYQIREITTLRGKDTEEGNLESNNYSDHMTKALAAQVGEFIKLEMYRYKRKLNSK